MELLGRFALRNEGKDNNFRVDLHPRCGCVAKGNQLAHYHLQPNHH